MAKKKAPAPAARKPINGIPVPFEPVPARLEPWLAKRNKSLLYLTHMDLNPIPLKRQVFCVPVLLNFFFLVFLAWRTWYISPWYASLLTSFMHLFNANSNSTSIWPLSNSSSISAWIKQELLTLTTIAIDYLLLTIVLPWPLSFFLGRPGNPTSWRRSIGFQARELIVRVSRGWDVDDLLHGEKKASESPFFVTRVFPAVGMERIGKTGYLLMDRDWDLDFAGMVDGQVEIDARGEGEGGVDEVAGRKGREDAFNGKMFGFWKPSGLSEEREGRWVMWDYRKDLYEKDGKSDEVEEAAGDATKGKKAVELFQSKLTEMGKEDLFYEWIELIHYESSRPGGFNKERQMEAGAKVKQLFEKYEVDFEKFEKDCGIVDGEILD